MKGVLVLISAMLFVCRAPERIHLVDISER